MGESTEQMSAREGAVRHLQSAVTTESTAEKNYHIKEALQLLDVSADDA